MTNFEAKSLDSRSYRDAVSLVEWLNLERPDLWKHQRKASRAIEILREINLGARGRRWPPELKPLGEEMGQIARPLERLRWRFMMQPGKEGRWYLDQTWSKDENYGLLLVARLSHHGLDWVRQCPCGKWFVSYSSRNRFHSGECREAFWAEKLKTPEGREHRREYMKRHRALKKKLRSKRREKR